MRINPRRATLVSAMIMAVCASAGLTLPTEAADTLPGPVPEAPSAAQALPSNRDVLPPKSEAAPLGFEAVPLESDDPPLLLTATNDLQLHADGSAVLPPPGAIAVAPGGKLQQWVAVETHMLDDLRGGFDTSLHLTLSFGIEKAVYLNGALVTTTSFNLPALRGMGIEDLAAGAGAGTVVGSGVGTGVGTGAGTTSGLSANSVPSSSIALLQNGPGNSFAASAAGTPLAATVIQNTLNNQSIQSLTTINAAANSLELLRANNFHNLLRDSISNGVGVR